MRGDRFDRLMASPSFRDTIRWEADEARREAEYDARIAKANALGFEGFHSDGCIEQIEDSEECVCRGGLLTERDALDVDPLLDRETDLFGRGCWQ